MTTLNNRTLIIILIALVVVYIGARVVRVPKREGALAIALVNIDTAAVRQIKLYPHKEGEARQELTFTRSVSGWQVTKDGLAAEADSNVVKGLMGTFVGMTANRVVAERESKWDEYRVGDTSGTRVVVLGDGDTQLGEWWVGEAPAQGGMYGGGQSYVRLATGDKVYAIEGYLHSQYNKVFNDWRNKAFLRLDKDNVAGVTASGIRAWALQRDSTAWLLDGSQADSMAAERYVGRFETMNLGDFADGFTPDRDADAVLTIHGSTGDLASVRAWKMGDSTWTIQASQRPQIFFIVDNEKFGEQIVPEASMLREK